MKIIPFCELGNHELSVMGIVVLRQQWYYGTSYHYSSLPRHNNAIVFFLGSGPVYRLPDGSIIAPERGDVLYLPEGAKYEVSCGENSCESRTCFFLCRNQNGYNIAFSDKVITLIHHHGLEFLPLIDSIYAIYNSVGGSRLLLQSGMLDLLDMFAARAQPEADRNLIAPALYRISHNIAEVPGISELSDICSMSVSTFRREFKRCKGVSPIQYINSEKLEKSRQLLRASELTVSEIVTMLGFYDDAYFNKVFKSKYHVTPAQYRKAQS